MLQTEYAIPIISINEFITIGINVDAIVITPVHVYDNVKNELLSVNACEKIISLENVIYENK